MKQRSTTPVSKKVSFAARACIVAVTVLTLAAAPFMTSKPALADQYDTQIAALKQEIEQYQNVAKDLSKKADTLQRQLDKLTNEKAQLQARIDLSQKKYDKLVEKITQAETDIQNNKQALGITLRDYYLEGETSTLELLASSDNITEFVDKQAYRESIQKSLSQTVKKIESLKKQLEEDRKSVSKVLEEQKNQKNLLVKKEQERARLIAQTRGEEAGYKKLVSKRKGQVASLYAQQQEAIQAATGGGKRTSGSVGSFQFRNYSGEQGCSGGYTYCSGPLDYGIDEFDLYTRECVSYAAWAAKYRFGGNVSSFMGLGHAYQWENPGTAPLAMGATINGSPSRGAVAIRPMSPGFPLGHAMVVESVLGDGWIRVSQYNFAVTGEYSTMEIPANSVRYVHFK